MSAPSAVMWQELLAELSRDWNVAEIELMNEAVADLHVKYAAKKKSLAGRTAMIVEDSVMMRMMLEEWLAKSNVIVTGRAENGYEAVKLYNGDERYDYVFLNVTMPQLDGIEALSDFKKDRDSKIIMVTSTKLSDLFLKSIHNGAHHVLYRPFDYGGLLSVMCAPSYFSPDQYGLVAGLLEGMGIAPGDMEHELTQQDVFRLAALTRRRGNE